MKRTLQRSMDILSRRMNRGLRHYRERLATGEAPFEYALLGLAAGLAAGTTVIAFRKCFEYGLAALYPVSEKNRLGPEQIDSLPTLVLFLAPAAGGMLIGLALQLLQPQYRHTGLPHVVYHAHNHDGKMPWRNGVVQFLGGLACALSAQSVGREGPAVHIGSATNSFLGQALRLPHNSLRILVGSGTAAAIAATFNTPIAGVIFAMEVVLVEYSITGFMPVILAAVAGTALTRLTYGAAPYIQLPDIVETGLLDLAVAAVLASLVAIASASFVRIQRYCLTFSNRPIWLRLTLAGMLTGTLAMFSPRILGAGYPMLEQMLSSPAPPLILSTIIMAKLVTTAASVGLGMPGGMISPNLFIGASIGSLLGQTVHMVAPALGGSTMLYALLGMAAMMGAVLNAPLAALMTLLELTYSPGVIFPGLLAITIANIFHREVFHQPSAVTAVLQQQGILLEQDPVSQALKRLGVSSLMNTQVAVGQRHMSRAALLELMAPRPEWIVCDDNDSSHLMLRSAIEEALEASPHEDTVDLTTIKGARTVAAIDPRSDLNQAWREMLRSGRDEVLVRSKHAYLLHANIGVITRKDIETFIYHRQGAKT
ncbi:MAG: chloride channel protein [Gammaproteobacteria bacterium]|nr:chloride channel protein [Gammaproteobacteria bacterium]